MNGAGKTVCCTRVGDLVFDLAAIEEKGYLADESEVVKGLGKSLFGHENLNTFMEQGKDVWHAVRVSLQAIFSKANEGKYKSLADEAATPYKDAKHVLPVFIRDYTDFYSSKNHAYNVGCMFRGPDNALQPNWLHLPVGYHGRASSVVLTGTDLVRQKGQITKDKLTPEWSKCNRLDFELEMGAYIGTGNKLGQPINIKNAEDHIFGFSILNDWSARDLQVWEYVPLGPFNAKNFGSTVSPWVITSEALAPFKVDLPTQDPKPLPYLQETAQSYDIKLDVAIKTPKGTKYQKLATSNFKHLYWSVNQQLTHHSVTGLSLIHI